MSLDLDRLTVRTSSGRVLLNDVSWSVSDGGRIGLIGESGSGKSLTGLAVLGLLPTGMTATGSVRLDGREILGLPDRKLRPLRGGRIAMIFQEPMTALDPLMTVGRQITGPLRLHRGMGRAEARQRVVALLDLVSLAEHERVLASFPWQLSGGQRQRVALALAMACEPTLLIADEPTTALDVTIQDEILSLLDRVVDRTAASLVFVSHDLPVVARVAPDLVVMRDGRVVDRGSSRDLLTAPSTDYTGELVDSARAVSALPQRPGTNPSNTSGDNDE